MEAAFVFEKNIATPFFAKVTQRSIISPVYAAADKDTSEELSEERRANLFQFLLRDLQVEGVPLLGVDANQVAGFQAALWTTLAELSEQNDAQKVCLIFEDVPVAALRTLVDDLMAVKMDQRLMDSVPELARFSLSLVGKGVGPAILIDAAEATDLSSPIKSTDAAGSIDDNRCTAALKMFFDRMVVGTELWPDMERGSSASGAPLAYRVCPFSDACHILSSFWNAVCEIMATPSDQLAASILALPKVGVDAEKDGVGRFSAISELVSRSLCLYQKEEEIVLDLLHFHPSYNRDEIYPSDQPAHGHIPPLDWLKSMLKSSKEADQSTQIHLINYQRRAPVPALCIKREPASDATNREIVDLKLDDGTVVQTTAVATYVRNAVKLFQQGENFLRRKLDEERAILSS